MGLIKKVKAKINETRLGKTFFGLYGFRTTVLALFSLIISVAFAVFNAVFGVMEGSVWYGALAVYYTTLILFRSGVIIADRVCAKKHCGETELLTARNKIHLASGAFLVVIEIAMAGVIAQTVTFPTPVNRDEIMAIATAAYTFTKITMAVYNLVKAKKFADPVSQSLRSLNLADACMSMVSLTAVLLVTFGSEEEHSFISYMKGGVGFGACVIVLALASYMIIASAKKLRKNSDE